MRVCGTMLCHHLLPNRCGAVRDGLLVHTLRVCVPLVMCHHLCPLCASPSGRPGECNTGVCPMSWAPSLPIGRRRPLRPGEYTCWCAPMSMCHTSLLCPIVCVVLGRPVSTQCWCGNQCDPQHTLTQRAGSVRDGLVSTHVVFLPM